MSLNPTNPVLGADHKPALGQTRGQEGNLEWYDSHTGAWRPAVRQHTIRNRLIRAANGAGSYTYARDGKGADVASFLPKDRDFGTAWAHRPPILFQLYPGHNRVAIKPRGVLMDGNRVMLDPYDHPIRNFPELPVTLSSKEKGMWIEYYMRQNKEIKPYDLMARMGKSVSGNAVRIYTLNERATKFRNTAACLSWGEKTGSAEKKAYILNLLPEGATDTRSLGKDLTKQQQQELVAANKGQFPNRRRKAKRTLEAQAPMAIPTPGFQPGASLLDNEFEGQGHQSRNESEQSGLEERDTQFAEGNKPTNLNELSFPGYGSQLGARQNMPGQDLSHSVSAGGASYDGYYNTHDNSSPANFLAPSQPYPTQNFIDNGRDMSALNNLSNHSYLGNSPTHYNGMNFLNPAQYGAVSGGQIMGGPFPAGAAGGYTSLQEQGDSLLGRPVNAPMQKRKRARVALAEDEAESSDNRRSKRVRTEAPVEVQEDAPAPALFGDEAESLLRFDDRGFVIQNNTQSTQARDDILYPEDFDEFLRDTEHGEDDAEGEDVQETTETPETQESSNELLEIPAPSPTQGQKRRRSSTTEDVEEVDEGPKSKRLRTEDIQTPEGSTSNGSEGVGASARPVNVARGQKRCRGSSESREETETSVETPPTKRQKVVPSADDSTTSDGKESTTTDEPSSDDDASGSSHQSTSSDDSDGSEYTPSPYHQTSLKTIARPPTGGKGPYGADGRPVAGGKGKGKGKGPLKSSRRANMARKAPAKRE